MPDFVSVRVEHGIAFLQIDNPPVNAIGQPVADAIIGGLEIAERDDAAQAIVVYGAGKTFIAGADITCLERAAWGDLSALPDLHALLARIEDCPKPVVMAIHGTALGGGLELAMAGHHRVAVADALMGQPEVNLGIIPGAECTQRLPRLVGVAKALDMCVTGKPIKAAEALSVGLIDAIVDDLLPGAAAFARDAASRSSPRRTRERVDRLGTPDENAPLFASARALAAKTRRGQIAPLAVVDAIEAATRLPFDDGCRREREIFEQCVLTEQAKALIHVFFAERAVSKVRDLPDVPPMPVARVAIVGAGTMGTGIATACANAGMQVMLKDSATEALARGMATLTGIYDAAIKRGRFTGDGAAERLGRITTQLTYEAFDTADVIIEAVFENAELKKKIFAEIDAVAKPSAVLATNTSTLDIDAIAAATSRPDRVVGLHFFSPAYIMRLLEVVRGGTTGGDVLITALAFAKRIGKVPVVVANCPGFVGNRMMFPYMYEAQFVVEEGATPEQVDRALTDFGMAMGIFAVDDMAGVDVAWRVRQELGQFGPGMRAPRVADKLCELGRYGQKTGSGWYRYGDDRKPMPDPIVIDLIRKTAAEAGIPQRTFTDEEIVERCLFALINEGARVIEDGAVQRASDIDVIYTNGYGFPAWRGGPMFYADRRGLADIHARIVEFERAHGARWTPAPLLTKLASSGGTFRELDRKSA
jgi:3-hydroxyacyl-CoA dehydrogenase